MRGMMGMPGMGGPGGGELTEKQKQELERLDKKKKALLAGTEDPDEEKDADKDKSDERLQEGGPWKEETRGLRWVAITGVLDHKKMRDNYLAALKNPAEAHPHYSHLDLQRQMRGPDGKWTDWEDVDAEKNREIVFNLPEEEEELTPDDVRIDALVDPLPFLKAGYWERVHVVSLVPRERRGAAKPAAGMMPGMMGGMMGEGGKGGMMGGMGGMGAGGMMPGMMGRMGGEKGGGMMRGMMGRGMMEGGGFYGGGSGANLNFEKSEAPKVMIRSLDFTVAPDTSYRYRLRVVVYNPNYKHEDVSPGVDTETLELRGPWSEPTDEVTMPADATAYAMGKFPTGPGSKRKDLVQYQVTRWNPEDGVTVVRDLTYGPGQIIGEPVTAQIPNTEGGKAAGKTIDFNSRQLMLDEEGGPKPINQVGVGGAPLDMPVIALLMRPDGSVVLRHMANDRPDPVRKDMLENYRRELKESGKQRQSSMGGMYGRMMGRGAGGGK